MPTYFETSVRHDKMMENGSVKRVTERFLVQAESFTEAEARITEELTPFVSEFSIPAIRITRIAEIVCPEADMYFLAKIALVTYNERTGTEKKSVTQMLVGGSDYDTAKVALEDAMKGTVSDWELASLSESQIVDVFNLKAKEE